MTTYSDTAPLMMTQVDAEVGYGGMPVLQQEPVRDSDISSADLRALHGKGDASLILAIVSFVGCFFCTIWIYGASMVCHIPAMLLAAKSRVSAEKKDYYDSKLMLHWSYICTFVGCFIGGIILLGVTITAIAIASVALSFTRH